MSLRNLRLRPRYHRWHVDPGIPWREVATGYASLDWRVPIDQAALLLVDVWKPGNYLEEAAQRAEEVIHEKIAPLVQNARHAGLQIIHAPGPIIARRSEFWIGPGIGESEEPGEKDEAQWPPMAFRQRTGEYQAYAHPEEPREIERRKRQESRTIHPHVGPEAPDVVVANGRECHELCRQRGLLFLFYAGFSTNGCVLTRDYGVIAMKRRGYGVLLLRDATDGMESAETQPRLEQTQNAIRFIEMFIGYSVETTELLDELATIREGEASR